MCEFAGQALEAEEQAAKDRVKCKQEAGGCESEQLDGAEAEASAAELEMPVKVRRLGSVSSLEAGPAGSARAAADAAAQCMQQTKREKQDLKAQKQLKKGAKKRKAGDEDLRLQSQPCDAGGASASAASVHIGKDGTKTRGLSEAADFSSVLHTKDSEREKTAIDDYLAALKFARANLPHAISEEDWLRTQSFCVSLFLELCWTCSVSVNGKLFKVYSLFRSESQKLVYSAHQQKISYNEKGFDPLALASNLLELVKAPAVG